MVLMLSNAAVLWPIRIPVFIDLLLTFVLIQDGARASSMKQSGDPAPAWSTFVSYFFGAFVLMKHTSAEIPYVS
jgi:hypothetical protein